MSVLLGEADATHIGRFLRKNIGSFYLPAVIAYEFGVIADGRDLTLDADTLLLNLSPEVVPTDERIAALARKTYRRYGKGYHKAKLNFADCLAYATAKELNTPLLYKGNDFSYTDIQSALLAG